MLGFERCAAYCKDLPLWAQYALAKILSQIKSSGGSVAIEILAQAKAKDPPSDALPQFMARYASHQRIGTLSKEQHTGKLVTEWDKLVSELATKPELLDMSGALSGFMACKDEEELVCLPQATPIVH